MATKTKQWEFGQQLLGRIESVERSACVEAMAFRPDDGQGVDGEMFILLQHPTKHEPGTAGKIVFEEGGPHGGHWNFYTP